MQPLRLEHGEQPQPLAQLRLQRRARCYILRLCTPLDVISSACIDAASARATSPAPPPEVCGVCASATKAETARYIHPISHNLATACTTPGASEAAAALKMR